MKFQVGLVLGAVFSIASVSCSKSSPTRKDVTQIRKPSNDQVSNNTDVSPSNVTPAQTQVSGDLTITKQQYSNLINKEYLFGSDLQFSSTKDEALGFSSMLSLSGGAHKIGQFKRAGSQLIFTSQEDVSVESDFRLTDNFLQFEITHEDDSSVSLKLLEAGSGSAKYWGVAQLSSRGGWLRSIELDPNDLTLILETSLRDDKGGVYHFTESALVRGTYGESARALFDTGDKANPDLQPLLARVGTFNVASFASAKSIDLESGVTKTPQSAINRYDISDKKSIEWYVTRNLPESLLNDIKAGVEGWNRYFNDFRKENPVMVFKGYLPENAKLGDPRFSVIQFDAVADAGAAYESQSFDPITGTQTHSLIYMPFAWYNFAKTANVPNAENDSDSNADAAKSRALLLKAIESINREAPNNNKTLSLLAKNALMDKASLRCQRTLDLKAAYGELLNSPKTADEAGRALMRSTLLHEVGHALGMQHNFKGNLAADPAKFGTKDWLYSNSVMDYNPPQLEDSQLFKSLNSDGSAKDPTVGALLPYDRQFIDIIYNQGKHVAAAPESFPVLPACDDSVADNTKLGIDPLCIRYGNFSDVKTAIETISNRVTSVKPETKVGLSTLTGSLNRAIVQFNAGLSQVQTIDDVISPSEKSDTVSSQAIASIADIVAYYVGAKSYLSYRTIPARYASLLGFWQPVTVESKDSLETKLLGLDKLPVFGEDGSFNKQAYIKYQKESQNLLLSVLEQSGTLVAQGTNLCRKAAPTVSGEKTANATRSSISDSLCSSLPLAELITKKEVFLVAFAKASQQYDVIVTALKNKFPNDEAQITEYFDSQKRTLAESLATVSDTMLARAETVIPFSGLNISGTESTGLPSVSTEVASKLFDLNNFLANSKDLSFQKRAVSFSFLSKLSLRPNAWDSQGNFVTKRQQTLCASQVYLEKQREKFNSQISTNGKFDPELLTEFETYTLTATLVNKTIEEINLSCKAN